MVVMCYLDSSFFPFLRPPIRTYQLLTAGGRLEKLGVGACFHAPTTSPGLRCRRMFPCADKAGELITIGDKLDAGACYHAPTEVIPTV